jgi:hypothetical protein
MARIQELAPRVAKGDKLALAEYEKLAKAMESNIGAANGATEKSVSGLPMPPDTTINDARWIIAKRNGTRASTLVVVYPLPALRRTVIQTAWDLTDYPSAWPAND